MRLSSARFSSLSVAALFLGGVALWAGSAFAAHTSSLLKDRVPGELLVRFKAPIHLMKEMPVRQNALARYDVRSRMASSSLGIEHWRLPDGGDVDAVINELIASGDVLYAEPNYVRRPRERFPDDPEFVRQWGWHNTGQSVNDVDGVAGADMALPQAWQLSTGSHSVSVGLIDDGFDLYHPDLENNFDLLAGVNMDGGGLPLPKPGDYHGTFIAGVLGAVGNNQTGITGVAWDVQMLPIRFDFSVSQEIKALDYALLQGVDFISLSYGGSDYSSAERDAFEKVANHGVLVFVAAGNNGVNNDLVPDYPSNYPFSNIVSVAASTSTDQLMSWSHFGQTSVDLMAPGHNIYTTSGKEGYRFSNGSSFSAPAVAGVAALIKSYHGQADWLEVKGRLYAGADVLSGSQPYLTTGGRVNAYRALTVDPVPVLTLNKLQIENESGGNQLVAGQGAKVMVTLENHWVDATGIQAVLSCSNPLVSIVKAEADFFDLLGGQKTTNIAPFEIQLSAETEGHQLLLFELAITTDQGELPARQWVVEAGQLNSGTPAFGMIQTVDQDATHTFWLDVPPDISRLRLKTTSETDIDLVVRHAAKPHYLYVAKKLELLSSELQDGTKSRLSSLPDGNEEITWTQPKPGRYWVVVGNSGGEANQAYCVSALMEKDSDLATLKTHNSHLWECGDEPPIMSSGGGADYGWWWLIVLLPALRVFRSVRLRK